MVMLFRPSLQAQTLSTDAVPEPCALSFHTVKSLLANIARLEAPPSFAPEKLQSDWPAAANIAARGELLEAGKCELVRGHGFNGLAVVKSVVGVQLGEKEQESVPTPQESILGQQPQRAAIQCSQAL